MEEGIYEVDVKTLGFTELFADSQEQKGKPPEGRRYADLPGYHGKGLYSGQGVLIYSNNGEKSKEALSNPRIPSGVLAEWDGKSDTWKVVRRNQFTEVTGRGGIYGSADPASDPIWATGWDNKSAILALREPATGWTFYRIPKASHSYDGAHGWNTEWPRIREIGDEEFLMTMHGTMWRFPKTFSSTNSAGLAPRSNYLKVIGDFSRWGDHVVFGCDDTAKAEFLNKRVAKGEISAAQSQSNLWFVKPDQIDNFGPVIGRGMVWEREDIAAAFSYSLLDIRNTNADPIFDGLAKPGEPLPAVSSEPSTATPAPWALLPPMHLENPLVTTSSMKNSNSSPPLKKANPHTATNTQRFRKVISSSSTKHPFFSTIKTASVGDFPKEKSATIRSAATALPARSSPSAIFSMPMALSMNSQRVMPAVL
jgi:hypothetical protein